MNRIRIAAIIEQNGQVLLCRHKDPFWKLPGGGSDEGEASDQTLRRELREEIGCEAEIGALVGVGENAYTFRGQHIQSLDLYFRVTFRDLQEGKEFFGPEGTQFRWFSKQELGNAPVSPIRLHELLSDLDSLAPVRHFRCETPPFDPGRSS
jgi:8-oxo-dGTP pyrophosphatase MutT (NUDIX family)